MATEQKSILIHLADACESVASRLEEQRPAGFSDRDIVELRATVALLYEMQRISESRHGEGEPQCK